MANFIIPIDKSIDAFTNFIKVAGKMSKKRQNKVIRLMIWVALFLIAILAAYGHFIVGHSLF